MKTAELSRFVAKAIIPGQRRVLRNEVRELRCENERVDHGYSGTLPTVGDIAGSFRPAPKRTPHGAVSPKSAVSAREKAREARLPQGMRRARTGRVELPFYSFTSSTMVCFGSCSFREQDS